MAIAHKGTTLDEALNSQKLQGKVPSDFLGATAKAVDSEKLDGLDSTQFLRSDSNTTLTGQLNINAGAEALDLKAGNSADHVYLAFYTRSSSLSNRSAWIGFGNAGSTDLAITNDIGHIYLKPLSSTGKAYVGSNEILNAGNLANFLVTTSVSGIMSSADKSKLDGIQTSAINQATADARYLQLTGGTLTSWVAFYNGVGLRGTQSNGTVKNLIVMNGGDGVDVGSPTNQLVLNSSLNPIWWNGTANQTLWHTGNFDPSTKSDTGHTHAVATASVSGFMSSAHFNKLAGIQDNAINQTTTDGRYLQLTGGTITGLTKFNATGRALIVGSGIATPNTSTTNGLERYLEIGGTGTTYPIKLGIVFHHEQISTSALVHTNTDANTSVFDFITDDTAIELRVAGNTVFHNGNKSSYLASTSVDGFMSSADKTKLNGIASGAEVNQNAFSTITVSGQANVVANAKSSTLTFVAGTGISITTDSSAMTVNFTSTLNGSYLALDGTNTMTGNLNFTSGVKSINFATTKIRDNSNGSLIISSTGTDKTLYLRPNGDSDSTNQFVVSMSGLTYAGNTIYHSGNFDPTTKLDKTGGTLSGAITLPNGSSGGIVIGGTRITDHASGYGFIMNSNYGSLSIGTAYDWDRLASLEFNPSSIGNNDQTLRIGQLMKNNTNWTQGRMELWTGGTSRLTLTNSLATFNVAVKGNGVGNTFRVDTGNGYVDIGAVNTTWAHFYTDRARYFFDKTIAINGGVISSFSSSDLTLSTGDSGTGGIARITVKNSNGYVGIGTTSPAYMLDVNGDIKSSGSLQSPNAFLFLNDGSAQSVKVGSLVVSSTYADTAPSNGIYALGKIRTNSDFDIMGKVQIKYNSTENSLDFVFI